MDRLKRKRGDGRNEPGATGARLKGSEKEWSQQNDRDRDTRETKRLKHKTTQNTALPSD